jgi:beta-glucosidase
LLTGRLAAPYVHGQKGNGIGACLKRLVANESETDRHTVDVQLDEANLRKVYLLPFEIAVEEADPWAAMAACDDINGEAATEHGAIINGIVKGEWQRPGLDAAR